MAHLESIRFIPHRPIVVDESVTWAQIACAKVIEELPQIAWNNGSLWREANLWALAQGTTRDVSIETVDSNMSALLTYANWLESTATDWWDFPIRKSDRCLVRYRKHLIEQRDANAMASSTASRKMSVAIMFYRWLHASGLISPDWPMWKERVVGIRLTDSFGLERTLPVITTDLAIKNRRMHGEVLEDGLIPVSTNDREAILSLAKTQTSDELFLMLTLGFFTGMRVGTLSDLKIQTLDRAVQDPSSPELFRLAVGPGADPPVATKGGVTGQIYISKVHLDALREYFYSVRRLKRQALAAPRYRSLVFLTPHGHPYVQRATSKSSAINVAMHSLRELGVASGIEVLRNFKFHQSRCTFATELARVAISHCGPINAIAIVKDALLHKHEETSLRYIKFVQKAPAKAAAADAFTRDFLGVISRQGDTNA